MFWKRILPVAIAGLVLASLVTVDAHAGQGKGKKPPPEPPPGETLINPAIVYVKAAGKGGSAGNHLFLMTADGTQWQQLTSAPYSHIRPTWSPDGTRVAYVRNQDGTNVGCGGLYARNVDGTGSEDLLLDFCNNTLGGPASSSSQMDWSAGDQIAFDGQSCLICGYIDSSAQIFVLDVATGTVENVVPTRTWGAVDYAHQAAWSPDLDLAVPGYQGKLAIAGGVYPPGGGAEPSGIVIFDPTTDSTMILSGTEDAGGGLDWSADGQWIVYNGVKKILADGTGSPIDLVAGDEPWRGKPRWSADGQYVVYEARIATRKSRQTDVLRMRADGSDIVNLTGTGKADEQMPDWNPAWVNDLDQ